MDHLSVYMSEDVFDDCRLMNWENILQDKPNQAWCQRYKFLPEIRIYSVKIQAQNWLGRLAIRWKLSVLEQTQLMGN